MSRPSKGPRLYWHAQRQRWVIRDGAVFHSTGCGASDARRAERALADYIGRKHKPQPGASPSIPDILIAYATDKGGHGRRAQNTAHTCGNILRGWGTKNLRDITANSCRAYAAIRPTAAARRDLETLRAAIRHWHKEYGPLPSVPQIWLPEKHEARERWLTRTEVSKLLRAARGVKHLERFLLLGVYSGTRSGALFAVKWDWIDLDAGVMHRRAPGTADSATKRRPPVRLGRKILAHLRRWKRIDGPMATYVIHYDGKPVKSVKRSWATAVRAAGLDDDVTPHCLRRTRATWLMQAGVDMWEAAGHLGMTTRMLEDVYAKHHPDWQKRASEV